MEDSGVGLAAELQAQLALPASSSGGGGGLPAWVPAVIAVPTALCLVAASAAGFFLLRRRRAAAKLGPAQAKAAAAGDEQQPLTPRTGKMDRMESGELKGSLQLDAVAGADVVTASPAGTATTAGTPLASPVLSRASSTAAGSASCLSDGTVMPAGGACAGPHHTTASKLWRARRAGPADAPSCSAWARILQCWDACMPCLLHHAMHPPTPCNFNYHLRRLVSHFVPAGSPE